MNRTLIQAAGKCDLELLTKTLAGEFGKVEEQDLNDALIRAAGVGYAEGIACLLEKGADPDAEDPYGETPVFHAAAGNHVRGLRMLINAGADLNWVNDSGRSAIHLAVKNDCGASVLLLLRSAGGCDTDVRDEDGDTALTMAAASSNALLLQMLLQANANVNIKNTENSTALHKAITHGSKICVMLLVDAKADVNIVDIHGNTPLLLACQNGHDDMGVMLMDLKPDVYFKDRQGKAPLDYVMEKGLGGIAEDLFALGALDQSESTNIAPIMQALTTGNRGFLRALLGANYNVNQKAKVNINKQEYCCTPLEAALRLRHVDMASLLLMGGSDLRSVREWCENRDTVPPDMAEDSKVMAWLTIMPRRPYGLRALCRSVMRKHLAFCPTGDVRKIVKLKAIQQYILFQKN